MTDLHEKIAAAPDDETQHLPAKNDGAAQRRAFDSLTDLIVGRERQRLSEVDQKVENLTEIVNQPISYSDIAPVLPNALVETARENPSQLSEATLPIVEENIKISADRHPQVLADALFPVIGPAIRRAIAEALRSMVQSLNQTLEQSLSPQSLQWRVEAWRTGKPFGEIVLLKTLLFRVEQVFLIHQQTGALLYDVSALPENSKDPEMISAMLTAIQDFVNDSFDSNPEAKLNELQVGELSVWIERGPDAVLAGVIRGNAPYELRDTFKNVIESIHFEQAEALEHFVGDAAPFALTRPQLEQCLQMQLGKENAPSANAKKNKLPVPAAAALSALGVLILFGAGYFGVDYYRWANLLALLKNEKGLVVTSAERGFRQHQIYGLRDNLARNPQEVLKETGYDADDVAMSWTPYQSLEPDFVLERARKVLQPPPTVDLHLEDGVLKASGSAPPQWIARAEILARAVSGVSEFDTQTLTRQN